MYLDLKIKNSYSWPCVGWSARNL